MPDTLHLHSNTPARAIAPIALAANADDLRRRLVVLTLLRLLVATALLALTAGIEFAGDVAGSATSRALFTVVLAIYVASLGYALTLARGRNLRTLALVQIALDLAAWTAVVYVTGGPASPMSFFFVLSPLTAALLLGERAARTTAGISIVIYGAIAVAMTGNLLRPLPGQPHRLPLRPSELAYQIVINVVGTLAVAGLGGSLASRVSRAGGALARVEASRADLTALYEDVLRSIPVALLTCTPGGTIDGANPVAATLFGVRVEELLGTPVTRWLPFVPADAFEHGKPPLAGDAMLGPSASHARVAYTAAPLFDRSGRVRGGLVVIEDRSRIEALREQVQRAERFAALGRLSAAMAHEIRNPLGAISGCAELVRENPALGSEDRDLLATVVAEAARLNNLVTDMLTFARPRAPERAPTDLVALAREVAALASTGGAAPASGSSSAIRVELRDADGTDVIAEVDRAQVRQVLWNLVRNAMQVSPPGAIVDVRVRASDEGSAELIVSDRGPGVPPELRERIFDPFYSSESSRGVGLGLAIVRQIVEGHGGTIDVRSREGGGTEMAVRFPRNQS